jgi:ankyrin repeat protein
MYDHPEGRKNDKLQRSVTMPDGGQLLKAAETGNLGAVKHLVQEGADLEEQSTKASTLEWTPIMLAFKESHLAIAEELVCCGANVNHRAKLGTTLLLEASEKGDTAFVKLALIAGAAVNATDNAVSTPVYCCLC